MNYKVRISGRVAYVSPPIDSEDPVESMILLVDPRYGDVVEVNNVKGAILALYDERQVNEKLQDGDTFTLVGHKRPFAYVEGVHVLPWRSR